MVGYGQETDGERIAASTSFVLSSAAGSSALTDIPMSTRPSSRPLPDHLDGAHRPNARVLA
jgi:hypothetical protein